MHTLLEKFIKSVITEKTRYEKETGSRHKPEHELMQFVSEHPSQYAFTMTHVNKVGINPGTRYDTPAGVYAYPLTKYFFDALIGDRLPFQSDAPYCQIIKLNWNKKWLVLGGIKESSESDVANAMKAVGWKAAHKAEFDGEHFKDGNSAKIYDYTWAASLTSSRPTVAWTSLLRKLGYVGIYDPDKGIIHTSEPTQLVCLDKGAYEHVASFVTSDLRKSGSLGHMEKLRIKFEKQDKDKKLQQWLQQEFESLDMTAGHILQTAKKGNSSKFIHGLIDKVIAYDHMSSKMEFFDFLIQFAKELKLDESHFRKIANSEYFKNISDFGFDGPTQVRKFLFTAKQNTPKEFIDTLLSTEGLDTDILGAIATAKLKLTKDQFEKLSQLILDSKEKIHWMLYDHMIKALSQNEHADPKKFLSLVDDVKMLESDLIDGEKIRDIYESNKNEIRKKFKNTAITKYELDEISSIIRGIVRNKNTPVDILRELLNIALKANPNNQLVSYTVLTLSSRGDVAKEVLQTQLDKLNQTLKDMADNPDFVTGFLSDEHSNEKLNDMINLVGSVLVNPSTPATKMKEIIFKLNNLKRPRYLKKVIDKVNSSQFVSPDILVRLTKLVGKDQILSLIGHENFPIKELSRLTHHHDPKISKAARGYLKDAKARKKT